MAGAWPSLARVAGRCWDVMRALKRYRACATRTGRVVDSSLPVARVGSKWDEALSALRARGMRALVFSAAAES